MFIVREAVNFSNLKVPETKVAKLVELGCMEAGETSLTASFSKSAFSPGDKASCEVSVDNSKSKKACR
jgi:hypothetical protein